MNKKQKKETAALFAESARLEYLRKLGKNGRSEEEELEFSRLYQKKRRQEQRTILRGEKSIYDKFNDAGQFWSANKLTLTKKQLDEYLTLEELVLDQEHWMEQGWRMPPDDHDFVGFIEGLADMENFIATRGLIHDDPVGYKQHPVLQDVSPPLWTRDFFKEAEIFNALCSESPATETYARYGIRTALSAYHVRTFKQRITEHERVKLQPDVRRAHLAFEFGRCWLCNEWKRRDAEGQSPQALVVPPPTPPSSSLI